MMTVLGSVGPAYATGRHVNGHTAVINRAPFGNPGSRVQIVHSPRRKSDPWVCDCDTLGSAFFSTASHTGPGWFWRRDDATPGQGLGRLYCTVDIRVAGPVLLPEDRTSMETLVQSLTEGRISHHRVLAVDYDRDLAPERVHENGDYWARHQLILTVSGHRFAFRPYAVGNDAVMNICAVLC